MKIKNTIQKNNSRNALQDQWNLGLLYSSTSDPKIEQDMNEVEKAFSNFAKKYDTADHSYLEKFVDLLKALIDYENLHKLGTPKPLIYFFYKQSLDSSDNFVNAQNSLLTNRLAKAVNLIQFFTISLGKIPKDIQKDLLEDPKLAHFHYMLSCIFSDAEYHLSVPEEKILALKSLPAKDLWVSHNDKILDSQVVTWNGKKIPINQALELISGLKTSKQRKKLAGIVYTALKSVAVFSEGEINAIYTDKKINDELRGFTTPYADTVREYKNDLKTVEKLRKVVTDNFPIAHRFFKIKAKLQKQKYLNYPDRGSKIGKIKSSYKFAESIDFLSKTFGAIDKKYSDILKMYVDNGQIDVFPKKGKTGGAYCSGSYGNPTFVLLNHVDDFRSLTTIAHEMGHAFHTELSQTQGPLYSSYSYSLAETASTLFESIAFEAVFETLSHKDKVILLHDKINNSIATIIRQIACFNFELDLHNKIRTEGFVSKEEIAKLHNVHMSAYLGPAFKMIPDDGYMFVSWGHIRRFFYVYSYAYGMIVSQALLRKYREDKSFWKKIEQFLSAGGINSPEKILKDIGINVSSPDFFLEGLKVIENDIDTLEKLTK